jgi:hypothetical protein
MNRLVRLFTDQGVGARVISRNSPVTENAVARSIGEPGADHPYEVGRLIRPCAQWRLGVVAAMAGLANLAFAHPAGRRFDELHRPPALLTEVVVVAAAGAALLEILRRLAVIGAPQPLESSAAMTETPAGLVRGWAGRFPIESPSDWRRSHDLNAPGKPGFRPTPARRPGAQVRDVLAHAGVPVVRAPGAEIGRLGDGRTTDA